MKKYLIWMVIICFIVSMVFTGSACKAEETIEEEVAEETVEEETVEEEATEEEAVEETVEEGITDEPITINIWAQGETESNIFRGAAELYMAEHPNVTINVTTQGSAYLRANGPIALASGAEELDVLWFWSNLGQGMASRGLLVDLAEAHETYGWWDKMTPIAREPMTSPDGGSYFFSYGHVAMPLVWYNKDIFEAIGAEVPDTIEEMLQIARDSIAAGYGGISNSSQLFEWDFSALGAHFMSDEEKEVLGFWSFMNIKEKAANVEMWRDSKGLRDCFEYLKSISDEGLYVEGNNLLNYGESQQFFAEGNSVIHTVGIWMANLWETYGDDFNVGLFPFPEAKIPEYFGNSVCIPTYVAERTPEKIPVILDFFDSILEPEYSKIVVANSLIPSSILLTQEDIAEVAHPLMTEFMEQLDTVGGESALHYGFSKTLESAFNEMGATVTDGTMSIDEAMEYIYNVAVADVSNTAW